METFESKASLAQWQWSWKAGYQWKTPYSINSSEGVGGTVQLGHAMRTREKEHAHLCTQLDTSIGLA